MVKQFSEATERMIEKLKEVKDPEIDTVSIVDLGMIQSIRVVEKSVSIELLPTFLGCPALPIIKKNIEQTLLHLDDVRSVEVLFVHSPPWTSDRISKAGREGLKKFGIAPPPRYFQDDGSWQVDCPFCQSTYVTLENLFGPTACRSILYCKSCKNPFEAMKPVSTI
ncbi:ring-1,2-phenylacetyl-CoA epoxidase subunit PaaD [Alkalihalobacillus xiaoxiensis]|uniref:Ring-1,2-phenylacetyl-CoA epoxidase subunit PaaD n=2 Tax=Shouchella xiaoxiensis TaxID=766895 RepID=A0ABS2SX34_9BACI|nr:ring-1,2-phenylacetyl-CoA epoxidase subunit PaaD [Shouchella xiaoxiensis]